MVRPRQRQLCQCLPAAWGAAAPAAWPAQVAPPTGAANRGNRVVAGFPKAATGSRASTPPRPAGPPRLAPPAPRLPSTPRVAPRPPPAAAAGGRTASTSPAKPIGDASASAARRTVAPRGPASSGGGGVDGGSGTEEGGAGRSRVAQISFEDLTVDKVLAGYCPTRQLNPVASSATFLHRSNRLSLVA